MDKLSVLCPLQAGRHVLPEYLRVLEEAALPFRLVLLHDKVVQLSPRIVTDTSQLPRNNQPGNTAPNPERISLHGLGDVHRCVVADASQLVAEIRRQGLNPVSQCDRGGT